MATSTFWPGVPLVVDYLAHPRIDANDDFATNSSVLNSDYKVAFEWQQFGSANMGIGTYDNLLIGTLMSSLITIPAGSLDFYLPTVAFGAIGPLGNQFLTTQTAHDGLAAPIPGDWVVMQPIEEANPINVAWGPLGVGSTRYNFVVNNSGGFAIDMIPTNYTNATSTPCNYVNDTSLVAWADYSSGNYNIWYKRSGCDWGSTGHYYRPVIKQADDCDAFSLAPNPATTAITLQAMGAYRITDMLGRELLQGTLVDKKQTIDISTLPEGTYIVSFTEEGNKTVYRKFTKL
ncbi:MAG: T9SS type A sorting domain-containing protein [Flavipsychrobacter sp.]|nr:T9SS type A sorting domain-containing protein [Flavipsychrobacter sp.]